MLPSHTLLVDWNGDGTFTGTSENISALTFDVECSRGRDYASQIQGKSIAGMLSAQINNQSKDYSSFNLSSPLVGSILPGRLVQLQESGTNLWTGYLKSINPSPQIKGINTVTLEAIGPLGFINRGKLSTPVYSTLLTGTLINNLLDYAGWGTGTAKRTTDNGQTTITKFFTNDLEPFEALRKIEETEAGFLLETKDGKIAYEDRWHRLVSPHTISQVLISDGPGGTLSYIGIEQRDPLEQIANLLEAEVTIYSAGSSTILWTLPEVGTNSPLIIRNSGTRLFIAPYPNPDSPTDSIAVDAWTTPVAGTDYTASSTAGAGTDMNTDITVAVEKLSNEMRITLTNTNPTSDAYVTKLQAQGSLLSRSDPVKVRQLDAPSMTLYGTREYANPAEFIPSSQEADNWGRLNLSIYKNPIPVLSVTFSANKDGTHLAHARDREISDRITIIGTGSAGLGVNEDFFIESIHHRISQHHEHIVSWECSQAKGFSDFWVLDTSELGTRTKLAY